MIIELKNYKINEKICVFNFKFNYFSLRSRININRERKRRIYFRFEIGRNSVVFFFVGVIVTYERKCVSIESEN